MHQGDQRRDGRWRVALLALTALSGGLLTFPAPSGAGQAELGGGAFGQSVSVSLASGLSTTSGPLPWVTLAGSGGRADDAAPSVAVVLGDSSAPFRGRLLETGPLTVSSSATAGPAGTTVSSASVALVDVLGGTLAATGVRTTCTSGEATSAGSTQVSEGVLEISGAETIDLPADPEPNTKVEGITTPSGDTVTVILNEQEVDGRSISVTGVHVILDGPAAAGDIILAQSRCTSPESVPAPRTDGGTTPDAPSDALATQPSRDQVAIALPGAGALASAAQLSGTELSAVTGGAYGYYTSVGLFGGPVGAQGPAPRVDLPAQGADPPATASVPSSKAQYGPAVIFQSGRITVSTGGKTGPQGSVTSSTDIQGIADGPGPFLFQRVRSTCTATDTGTTGSSIINGGILETKYDVETQDPTKTEAVPVNPPANTERTGTIDHVGDSFRIVFNEQTRSADGTLTVNAAHMYLLGPIAKGELVVGQSRCGATVTRSDVTSTTPPSIASPSGTSPPAATGSSAVVGAAAGAGSSTISSSGSASVATSAPGSVAGGSATRTGGQAAASSPAGTPLAHTGADASLLPVLALMLAAGAARRGAKLRRCP